jgi:hypothetical protein
MLLAKDNNVKGMEKVKLMQRKKNERTKKQLLFPRHKEDPSHLFIHNILV